MVVSKNPDRTKVGERSMNIKGIELKRGASIKIEDLGQLESTDEDWEHTIVGTIGYHQKAVKSAEGEIFYFWFCPCGAPIVKTITNEYIEMGELKKNGSWKICMLGHINTLYKRNGDAVWHSYEVKQALKEVI